MSRYASGDTTMRRAAVPVQVYEGTPYDSKPAELAVLQDPHMDAHSPAWRPLHPPTSQGEALARLLTPSARKHGFDDARNRIRQAMTMSYAGYDLPIKMFNDLDTVIFHNKLRRRVCLSWQLLTSEDPRTRNNPYAVRLATTKAPGLGRQQRIAIEMNIEAPWDLFTRQDIVGILVHEMVHAWYMVHCGIPPDVVVAEGMDEGHGYYFHSARLYIEQNYGLKLTSPLRGRR